MIQFSSLALIAFCGCANVAIPAPRNVAVVPQADGAHVTWDEITGLATELLVEKKVPGGTFQRVASLSSSEVAFVDPAPVTVGAAYRVLAYAEDQPAIGTYSKEARLR